MATTYKYKNNYGNYLNQQQAELSEEFLKKFHVDGVLKKMERIINNSVDQIYYYLNSSESINDLLSEFANKRISFYAISTINGYTVEDVNFYDNGVLKSKSKSIINNQDQLICFQSIDITTGLPIYTDTRKYFYLNGLSKYTFEYDDSGNCFIIYDDTTDQQDIFAWDIGTPNTDFTWQGFEYYQYADPIIPV